MTLSRATYNFCSFFLLQPSSWRLGAMLRGPAVDLNSQSKLSYYIPQFDFCTAVKWENSFHHTVWRALYEAAILGFILTWFWGSSPASPLTARCTVFPLTRVNWLYVNAEMSTLEAAQFLRQALAFEFQEQERPADVSVFEKQLKCALLEGFWS